MPHFRLRFADSIVTRLVVFAVGFVLLANVLRYYSLAGFMREDLIRVVSLQQEALARDMARDVGYKLGERRKMLGQLAASLPVNLLRRPERLRAWLGERHELHPVFSQGLFLSLHSTVLPWQTTHNARNASRLTMPTVIIFRVR